MTRRLVLQPEAEDDIRSARRWYDRQSPGLGSELLRAVEASLGFATVAPGHVEIDGLPAAVRKKLSRYPLPVLRLARFAVDEAARGQGLGNARGYLSRRAPYHSESSADPVGNRSPTERTYDSLRPPVPFRLSSNARCLGEVVKRKVP